MIHAPNKLFRINVVGFLIIASFILLLNSFVSGEPIFTVALNAGGINGLIFSGIGAVLCYMSFFYDRFSIWRALTFGPVINIFLVFILIGTVGEQYPIVVELVSIVILFMFFATLGTINAYFGKYMSLFSVCVFVWAVVHNQYADPFIWVNVLDLMEIKHPIAQWGIILTSAILGADGAIKPLLGK
ncbi:hypothetical protein AMS58_01315 [Pseudoalteromonas porphyrae]|uniref:hypothetical protein n=1 Tax=Pseudoalteromonas porphyrae TaxID=187330 RepID=UPI0006BAE6F3|nr:hypothetical protein [Pseudoalteromonas porphyrae]KPH96233.1 hypothetical protein AMS58_01315 [Pseudoalteromonas porphyrae]